MRCVWWVCALGTTGFSSWVRHIVHCRSFSLKSGPSGVVVQRWIKEFPYWRMESESSEHFLTLVSNQKITVPSELD